jgi:hypothetical protein
MKGRRRPHLHDGTLTENARRTEYTHMVIFLGERILFAGTVYISDNTKHNEISLLLVIGNDHSFAIYFPWPANQ